MPSREIVHTNHETILCTSRTINRTIQKVHQGNVINHWLQWGHSIDSEIGIDLMDSAGGVNRAGIRVRTEFGVYLYSSEEVDW